MQWTFPPPSRISRPGTPTISLSGEGFPEDLGGLLVGALVEQREDDPRGGDETVGIGGGHRFARRPRQGAGSLLDAAGLLGRDPQRARSRQADHLDLPPLRIASLPQPPLGILCRGARRVILAGPGQEHHPRTGEAGQIVDMAVGLIAKHAVAQPQDAADAQVLDSGPPRSARG